MGIGYLIGSWIPIMDIGKSFAHAIGCKEGIFEYLTSTFAISIIMTVLISACCVFVQAGEMFLQVWLSMLLPFLLVGTVAIEITLAGIIRLVQKIIN